MASDVVIQDAEGIVHVTLAGLVFAGDPIAHNGTNWVQADASDAATNLYAQYIAGAQGVSGQIIPAYRRCTIYDADAPYTANATAYLSGTAGAITHTRPTTAADVIQILGRALSTYELRVDIKAPWEMEVLIPVSAYDTTGEPGLGIIDNTLWVGPGIDTVGEDVYFTSRFPSNVLSVDAARVVYNSIGESTGAISATIVVAADGTTNVGDTGTAYAATVPTSAADNVLCYSDITACFDAGALKPNYNFSIAITSSVSVADYQVLGLYMRYIVV